MTATAPAKGKATEASLPPIKPLQADRVIDLANATGYPKQIVLPDAVDPEYALANVGYWQQLGATHLPVGCKFEMTNDCGSFLWEVWVRRIHGNASSGIRHIQFHSRSVWHEELNEAPVVATGEFQLRYEGRHLRWRVYGPNGELAANTTFNSEAEARDYMLQASRNPKPR